MRVVRIPKGKGRWRTIYVPDDREMYALRGLCGELRDLAETTDRHGVQHAFTRGRSPVTNALAHRGFRYTMKFDLTDFFDTVTKERFLEVLLKANVARSAEEAVLNCEKAKFAGRVKDGTLDICFQDGAARQGLPTSPFVANIAASPLDADLIGLAGRRGRFDGRFAYTRYADDLTFSFDAPHLIAALKQSVPEVVARHGFVLNERKTRVMFAGAGRRMVTGIAVDDGIHPPRSLKRKLRAARHRGRPSEVKGMEEWCALKPPKAYQSPKPAAGVPLRHYPARAAEPVPDPENAANPVLSAARAVPADVLTRRFDFSD